MANKKNFWVESSLDILLVYEHAMKHKKGNREFPVKEKKRNICVEISKRSNLLITRSL